ncbi:hypothetical protein, partial [uncultured Campylobacter sp.]|uniref:hypothetical protein n=1 Tax=uncultured Campylobacter sp. TaxID=218934 RepID=UPI0026118957
MSVSVNLLARCLCSSSHPSAKFNHELCRKKQEPNKARRPIKFYAERSKSACTSSRKSPIWRQNLASGCLKKPLFS